MNEDLICIFVKLKGIMSCTSLSPGKDNLFWLITRSSFTLMIETGTRLNMTLILMGERFGIILVSSEKSDLIIKLLSRFKKIQNTIY